MLFCDSINTGFSSNSEDRSSRIQFRHPINASMTVIQGSPGTHWCQFVHSSDTLYCNTKFMLLQVTDFNCNRHNIGGISGNIKMGESLMPTLLWTQTTMTNQHYSCCFVLCLGILRQGLTLQFTLTWHFLPSPLSSHSQCEDLPQAPKGWAYRCEPTWQVQFLLVCCFRFSKQGLTTELRVAWNSLFYPSLEKAVAEGTEGTHTITTPAHVRTEGTEGIHYHHTSSCWDWRRGHHHAQFWHCDFKLPTL